MPSFRAVRQGGWIVSVYNAIRDFNLEDTFFEDYEALIDAARSAEFISSIRKLDSVPEPTYQIYRKLSQLRARKMDHLLARYEALGVAHVSWSAQTAPRQLVSIQSAVENRSGVLEFAARLFEAENSSAKASCILFTLEATVGFPIREAELIEAALQNGFDESISRAAIHDATVFHLLSRTQETAGGEALLHNPHLFKSEAKDIYKILSGLTEPDKEAAISILSHVRHQPGVPFPPRTNRALVTLLVRLGAIDVSGIQLASSKIAGEFPTSPDAWGVFAGSTANPTSKDLIDDSKLFLNSLRYGEYYSTAGRGKIISTPVLIGALLDRGQVGAATAIGEDYPLPLARGIVSIIESRFQPGRFFMELRKKDVVESVREVIEQKAILPAVREHEATMAATGGAFTSPESMRFKRDLPKEFVQARDNMIFDLRSYRRRQ